MACELGGVVPRAVAVECAILRKILIVENAALGKEALLNSDIVLAGLLLHKERVLIHGVELQREGEAVFEGEGA